MNGDALIVNLVAIFLIIAGFWWFFGSDLDAFWQQTNTVTVIVKDGKYEPALIQSERDKPLQLKFIREDDSLCSDSLLFPALNTQYNLPLHEAVLVNLPKLSANEIKFTCQMGLLEGKVVAT